MASWKQFADASDGEAIREEGGACRTGGTTCAEALDLDPNSLRQNDSI
jgi:hypothetical protein